MARNFTHLETRTLFRRILRAIDVVPRLFLEHLKHGEWNQRPRVHARPTSVRAEKALVCVLCFRTNSWRQSRDLQQTQSARKRLFVSRHPRTTFSADWLGGDHWSDVINTFLSHYRNKKELSWPVLKFTVLYVSLFHDASDTNFSLYTIMWDHRLVNYFLEVKGNWTMKWSVRSSDLNPVEHVFDVVERVMACKPSSRNHKD